MTTRAPRMAPAERKEQLLDSAVGFVLERGLSDFSLEKVAARAGVSVPLIYKYFPKREDILKAVLEREYRYLGTSKLAGLSTDAPLEPLIRNSNRHGFAYLYERGPIIRLLASDRAVAGLVRDHGRLERSTITEHFIDRLVDAYGVPRQVAEVCSILVVNAPILSGRALKKVGISAEEAADLWTDFALGGWAALQRRFEGVPTRRAAPARAAAPVEPKAPALAARAGVKKGQSIAREAGTPKARARVKGRVSAVAQGSGKRR